MRFGGFAGFALIFVGQREGKVVVFDFVNIFEVWR